MLEEAEEEERRGEHGEGGQVEREGVVGAACE